MDTNNIHSIDVQGKILEGNDSKIKLANTFYTPKEMLHKGVYGINDETDIVDYAKNNFYGVKAYKDTMIDNETKVEDWFEEHSMRFAGMQTDKSGKYDILLDRTLKDEWLILKELIENEEPITIINSHKQYMLELGWNSNIAYNGQIINRLDFVNKQSYKIVKVPDEVNNINTIITESDKSDLNFKSPAELSNWMKDNIKYSEFTRLKSPYDVQHDKKGSCHDQVLFELCAFENMDIEPRAMFLIEYDNNNNGGTTHTFIYYTKHNKTYWFENAWDDYQGIEEYNSIDEIKSKIISLHTDREFGNFNKFPNIMFKPFIVDNHKIGETLSEFVEVSLKDEVITEYHKVKEYNGDNVPVFILLSSNDTVQSKVIRKVTKYESSHSSISFDPSLTMVYSFTPGGFTYENILEYIDKHSNIKLYAVIMSKNQAKNIRFKLDELLNGKKKFGYNYLGIMGFLLKEPIKRNDRMFCSEFVDAMFRLANIDLTQKGAGLVSPGDFSKSTNKNIYELYDGTAKAYTAYKVEKKVDKILSSYIKEFAILNEVKEFPVQFDKDGNLLIKKINKLNYAEEYYKCHKLLVIYHKTNNIEGMKYELSKLWFLNNILEYKIYNEKLNDTTKKEYIKTRAKILNDFKQYLEYVSKEDNNFNFIEYYDNTPFSDATFKINKYTVKHSIELLKMVLKP